MITIKVFQDLEECGLDEKKRMEFILSAINDHKGSNKYKEAEIAYSYYKGENTTIARFERIVYDLLGNAHRDKYKPNHKIASKFFPVFVKQKVSYLLGNGVSFKKKYDDKLGKDFDRRVMEAAKKSAWGGESYSFFNMDRIKVFSFLEFIPLKDEETSAIKAGIRFWQLDDARPLRVTLYELDGYTEYIRRKGEDMVILRNKRPYIVTERTSEADGTEIVDSRNYPGFPIIPLKNNEESTSDIHGNRNTIDALDLMSSGMVNNTDAGSLIYWVLKNAGGMDDLDDVKFTERLKTIGVVHVDDGVEADAHQLEAPVESSRATIDMLKKQLYDDFQAFDSSAVSAGNQTATAIDASYSPLDLKVDDFELEVSDYIAAILELAGIDDEPGYTRNKIINKMEEVQTVVLAGENLSSEYKTKKILTILGDADKFDEVMKQITEEEVSRFTEEPTEEPPEDVIMDET